MFVVLVVGIFAIPQIALAAWWNPLSWSIWNVFKPAPKVQEVQIATTTPTTSTATKQETSVVAPKKQVVDLTQKVVQSKTEVPKTSIVTLPSGAIVEMDANGNIIRTIQAAPQQTYVPPTSATTQTQSQTPPPVSASAPVSRTLEASLQSDAPEIHSKVGAEALRVPLFRFVLKASGNADTHVSKIRFRTLGPTYFTDMWVEANNGSYVGSKVSASSIFSGGYGSVPVSITLAPGATTNFTLYVNVPAGAATRSGAEQLYMEGITSDAGSMSDFPMQANPLFYDN